MFLIFFLIYGSIVLWGCGVGGGEPGGYRSPGIMTTNKTHMRVNWKRVAGNFVDLTQLDGRFHSLAK